MSDREVVRATNELIHGHLDKIAELLEDQYEYVVQMSEPGVTSLALMMLTYHYEMIDDEIADSRNAIRELKLTLPPF